jgi:hypothetical protein
MNVRANEYDRRDKIAIVLLFISAFLFLSARMTIATPGARMTEYLLCASVTSFVQVFAKMRIRIVAAVFVVTCIIFAYCESANREEFIRGTYQLKYDILERSTTQSAMGS